MLLRANNDMLRTPKERFLESTHSGAWGKMILSEAAEEAVHSALEQLACEMPIETTIPQQACDAHQQMAGARKYMEILCSLHVKNTTPTPNQPKGLDYSAGV